MAITQITGVTPLPSSVANVSAAVSFPETFGAVGDGVTDDTAAMQSWVASGKSLQLTPGKTYVCRQQLVLALAGQTINGNGASIKRPAQGITTTTTAITGGTTNAITVASTTGFQVGDQIVVENGGFFDLVAQTILSIVGSVITITGTFGNASGTGFSNNNATQANLAGGSNVRTVANQIAVSAADVRVTNTTFDGSSASWSWGRWQNMCAITAGYSSPTVGASRLMVDHCRFVNQYGDAIAWLGQGQIVAFNSFENLAGRGIVPAGVSPQYSDAGTRIVFNRLISCNTDTAVGGNDGLGSINFSQGGQGTLIHGNYINGGVHGIGSVRNAANSQVNITGNEFYNLSGQSIDGGGAVAVPQQAMGVLVSDNRFYGSSVQLPPNLLPGLTNWKVQGNLFVGAQLQLLGGVLLGVAHNTFIPMQPPDQLYVTPVASGGSFAAGTYYGVVTATNAAGETVGSMEASVTVVLNGQAQWRWTTVSNAVTYKLYRATTAGGESGASSLVATVAAPATSFLDSGAAPGVGAVPTNDSTFTGTPFIVIGSAGATIRRVLIANNTFQGGQWAVQLSGAILAANLSEISIRGNVMIGQYTGGVATAQSFKNIAVKENMIVGNAASNSGFQGISLLGTAEASGNTIDVAAVPTAAYGILIQTSTKAVAKHNTIYTAGNRQNIQLTASATNTLVQNNTLDLAITDGGTNTTKIGNTFSSGAVSGKAVLVAGTVTVSTAEIQTGDRVLLSVVVAGGTQGILSVGTITNGVSFVINSTNAADTSTVYWRIDH